MRAISPVISQEVWKYLFAVHLAENFDDLMHINSYHVPEVSSKDLFYHSLFITFKTL